MSNLLKVAAAQTGPVMTEDPEAMLPAATAMMEEAAKRKVDIVTFSELFMTPFFPNKLRQDFDHFFVAADGPLMKKLCGLSRQHGIATIWPFGERTAAGGYFNSALACDERVMREDRGYFCLPEVDINIPFLPGMSKLVQAKLTPDAAHKAMLSGCRFTGPEAVEWGIASAAVPEDQVLTVAAERAAPLAGKGRETVATIKKVMYASAIETLALQESF